MTEIYSCASKVLIWFGKQDEAMINALKAMDFFFREMGDDVDNWDRRGKGKMGDRLVTFFKNEWFERAWIFQEVVCSKGATVYAGMREIASNGPKFAPFIALLGRFECLRVSPRSTSASLGLSLTCKRSAM
jgi:hypothetical protein